MTWASSHAAFSSAPAPLPGTIARAPAATRGRCGSMRAQQRMRRCPLRRLKGRASPCARASRQSARHKLVAFLRLGCHIKLVPWCGGAPMPTICARAPANSPNSPLPALLRHSSHGRLQQQPEDVGPRQRARPERQDGAGDWREQRVRAAAAGGRWRRCSARGSARSLALSQARPGDGQAARREALHGCNGLVRCAGARVRWTAPCGPPACGPRSARGRPVAAHTPGAPRRARLATVWRRAPNARVRVDAAPPRRRPQPQPGARRGGDGAAARGGAGREGGVPEGARRSSARHAQPTPRGAHTLARPAARSWTCAAKSR